METIGKHKIWSLYNSNSADVARNSDIRKGPGYYVKSYWELVAKVAELQFLNRDYVFLFRGQSNDFKNSKGNSSLKPTLFRPLKNGNPSQPTLLSRFYNLKRAEIELLSLYRQSKLIGIERLERHRVLRWSILQHYEVCPTPLLDVTQSLRIAASFASIDHEEAFIFVLGVPNISGAITASAEAGVQIVRLSSVCPPAALRPHMQEGYLLGEYPELWDYEQKELYRHYEIDFGRRLIAKFRFDPKTFWKKDTFPKVAKQALFPSADRDPLNQVAQGIKELIPGI